MVSISLNRPVLKLWKWVFYDQDFRDKALCDLIVERGGAGVNQVARQKVRDAWKSQLKTFYGHHQRTLLFLKHLIKALSAGDVHERMA